MFNSKIAGAAAALALIAAPATAAAHDGHHHGRHHGTHHVKKAHVREVTGRATATVTSFTGGDLTLTLPSGRTFTAAVTDRTIIDCFTAAPQATTARHGSDDGPNHDAGDDHGDDGPNHDAGDDHGDDGANHDQGDDNGNGRCDATALVTGAKVASANLSLRGGDATWKKVVIVK
jgi:hypothetical protein